jgi:hypothetical protein
MNHRNPTETTAKPPQEFAPVDRPHIFRAELQRLLL